MSVPHISMSSPEIDESDERAVLEVLRSGRLALGSKAAEFEHAIAEYVGVRHAIAVSSGTAALHLVVKALGIGLGDELIVPSFTFAASVNVLLYEGATPVFADVKPETYNIDLSDVERKVGPRTKAILAVDVFGHPAEWDAVLKVAQRYGLRVIDDSCEALAAQYKGRMMGQFGDAAAFAWGTLVREHGLTSSSNTSGIYFLRPHLYRSAFIWFSVALVVRCVSTLVLHVYSFEAGFEGFYPLSSGADDRYYFESAIGLLEGHHPTDLPNAYPVFWPVFS